MVNGEILETVGFHPIYCRKVGFLGKIVNDKTILAKGSIFGPLPPVSGEKELKKANIFY